MGPVKYVIRATVLPFKMLYYRCFYYDIFVSEFRCETCSHTWHKCLPWYLRKTGLDNWTVWGTRIKYYIEYIVYSIVHTTCNVLTRKFTFTPAFVTYAKLWTENDFTIWWIFHIKLTWVIVIFHVFKAGVLAAFSRQLTAKRRQRTFSCFCCFILLPLGIISWTNISCHLPNLHQHIFSTFCIYVYFLSSGCLLTAVHSRCLLPS